VASERETKRSGSELSLGRPCAAAGLAKFWLARPSIAEVGRAAQLIRAWIGPAARAYIHPRRSATPSLGRSFVPALDYLFWLPTTSLAACLAPSLRVVTARTSGYALTSPKLLRLRRHSLLNSALPTIAHDERTRHVSIDCDGSGPATGLLGSV
jgi:hypothetical protein